jgi:hypothetical protein
MGSEPKSFLTPDGYLALERVPESNSEYWNGPNVRDGWRDPVSRQGRPKFSRPLCVSGFAVPVANDPPVSIPLRSLSQPPLRIADIYEKIDWPGD